MILSLSCLVILEKNTLSWRETIPFPFLFLLYHEGKPKTHSTSNLNT